jgi:hypothetical protein
MAISSPDLNNFQPWRNKRTNKIFDAVKASDIDSFGGYIEQKRQPRQDTPTQSLAFLPYQ